jgi:hypothetical protein
MEHTKNYTLTVREVLENLRTLGDSFETVSRGGSPTGNYFFEVNVADTAASIKAAQVLISQLPFWIPVSEQWPEHLSEVLVSYKCGKYVRLGVGEFDGTTVNDEGLTIPYFKGIGGLEVTHWMPLPEPPEVTECRHPAAATDNLSQGL